MAEIISAWIRSRLGVIIDLTGPSIENCCQDGTFYAKLLHSYAVINESQLNTIIHTSDPALARVNLRHLQVWLRFIGVECDREAIEDISNGKGTAAFQLLYKMYLCLENKDRLHFITLEKEREKYVPASTKFDVKVVPEEPEFEKTLPEHPLLKLLEINTQLSGSHKEDVKKMITNYLRERHSKVSSSQASRILTDNEDSDDGSLKSKTVARKIDKKEVRRNAKKKMMKELDDFAEKHADISRSKTEEPYDVHGRPEAAKQYIEELKARRKRDSEIDQRNKEIQNRVLTYFWDKFEEDQQNHFDKIIAGAVLRQSDYEKKMTTKLCEIRRQKDRIAANRQMVNEMMFKAKEDHMRLVEESKREMKAWDDEELEDEVRRFNELQRRLQEEQEEKTRREVCKIAQDVVDDVVDLAVYSLDTEIPRGLWNEWKSLFVRGLQIFSCKVDSQDKLGSQPEVISDYLQDKDLRDYIDINAPWNEFIPEIDQESKEFIELGSIALSYIVHKLLLKFPQEFLRPKLPEVSVRAILLGVSDPKHYSTLQDLLKHQKISVIRVEDAINYCLQCYKGEKKDEDSTEEFKLETHSESSIKSPEESTLNVEDKSKNITKIEKKTQTSRVIPFDDMHPKLSDSAYIGEWTYRFIIQGQPVSDELLAKVIFEYLKSFDDIKGWVLMNYPVTYRQLAFLELSLSGRPLSDVNKVFSFNEDDIEDYEFEPQIKFIDSDESFCRESKLLPHLVKSDVKYNSCLTAYVRMIEKPAEVEVNAEELLEIRAEDLTRVDEFYRDQGVARVVYYNECDSKTLKRVARLVIGDDRAPRKFSEEIFESEEFRNSSVKSLSVKSSQSQECKVKPGELNWTWVDLPLNFEVSKELVSLWRNCESTYVNELKDILSLKRLNLTAIIPYKDFVYNRVAQSGKIGSDKQELVKKFKEAFNSVIESGFDEVKKSELRGDVEEFQMELWEICDAKRLKADEERKKIILDDWTSKQVIVLVNIYVRIIQIEINRFVDTLEFLRCYYLTILQRTIEYNIFRKIILDKVSGNCRGAEKKCPKLPEINDAALQKVIQSLMLGVSDNLEEVIDHCLEAITPTIDYAQSIVEELSNSAVGDLKKERGSKSKRRCSTVRVKRKSEKLSDVSVKPKKVKLGSKKKNLFLEWKYALMYEINRVKMRVQILNSAVKADIEFLLVNIKRGFSLAGQSINERYKIEIDNVNDLFKLFEKAIEDEHLIEEEINLVNDCFVIPKDVKIVEPLVSEAEIDDKFRIEQLCYLKDVFQSVEPRGIISKVSFVYILQDLITCEESEVEEEEEELKEGEYVISSLPTAWLKLTAQEIKKIVDEVFEDDTVDWREFIVYALDVNLSQDAMLDALDAFKQKDSDKDQIISRKEFFSVHLWPFNLKITHEEVEKEEILDAERLNNKTDDLDKSQDEKIEDKEEISLEENDEEEIGRLYLMKLFVCDMFSNDDSVNYMEVLFAFCKDEEPIYGFGKTLSIFLGQKICMDYDEGEKYVASIEKQHSQQVIKRYAKRVSEKCVDELIDCVAENLDRVDGSLERNIENAKLVVEDQENLRLLSPSDEKDLKLTKSDEEDLKLTKSDEEDLKLSKLDKEDLKLTKSDQEDLNFSESDEDLLLYYNENYYDEQCHDIVYFNAGGRQARRKNTRKMVYWISIDFCESVLTSLLPQIVIEDLEASTGVSLKENLRTVSKELRCKDTKISCKLVLAHRLIRHDLITRMLASTNRFTAKNLSSILRKIIKAK